MGGMWKRMTDKSNPYLWFRGFWLNLGTLMFTFVYHDSAFSVYKQLAKPSVSAWKKTSLIAIGLIFAIQMSFGAMCTMRFGTDVPSNVLTASWSDSPVFKPNHWVTKSGQSTDSTLDPRTSEATLTQSRRGFPWYLGRMVC